MAAFAAPMIARLAGIRNVVGRLAGGSADEAVGGGACAAGGRAACSECVPRMVGPCPGVDHCETKPEWGILQVTQGVGGGFGGVPGAVRGRAPGDGPRHETTVDRRAPRP